MTKLDELKSTLQEHAGIDSALWFSGGADSRLLLEIILQNSLSYTILRFNDGWTRRQSKYVQDMIGARPVDLYSYRAAGHMLIAVDEQVSLVSLYPLGKPGQNMPVVRDMVPGSRCSFDIRLEWDSAVPPIKFTTHVFGTKKVDRHYAFDHQKQMAPGPEWHEDDFTFLAPLFDWTDSDVAEGLATIGVKHKKPAEDLDTGNVPACVACLVPGEGQVYCKKVGYDIDRVDWNPQTNLEMLHQIMRLEDRNDGS